MLSGQIMAQGLKVIRKAKRNPRDEKMPSSKRSNKTGKSQGKGSKKGGKCQEGNNMKTFEQHEAQRLKQQEGARAVNVNPDDICDQLTAYWHNYWTTDENNPSTADHAAFQHLLHQTLPPQAIDVDVKIWNSGGKVYETSRLSPRRV